MAGIRRCGFRWNSNFLAMKRILRREGDGLVIEPPPKRRLLDLLATWEPLDEEFPEITDEPVKSEDVEQWDRREQWGRREQ